MAGYESSVSHPGAMMNRVFPQSSSRPLFACRQSQQQASACQDGVQEASRCFHRERRIARGLPALSPLLGGVLANSIVLLGTPRQKQNVGVSKGVKVLGVPVCQPEFVLNFWERKNILFCSNASRRWRIHRQHGRMSNRSLRRTLHAEPIRTHLPKRASRSTSVFVSSNETFPFVKTVVRLPFFQRRVTDWVTPVFSTPNGSSP